MNRGIDRLFLEYLKESIRNSHAETRSKTTNSERKLCIGGTILLIVGTLSFHGRERKSEQ